MGQRLIIHMMHYDEKKNDYIEIANAYYHWSAYTEESLYQIKILLEALKNDTTKYKYRGKNRSLIKALMAFQATGAYLTSHYGSLIKATKQFPEYEFKTATNRNNGLVEITKEGMKENDSWSEGDAWIFINEMTADFNIYFYPSNDKGEELTDEEYKQLEETSPKINYSILDLESVTTLVELFAEYEVVSINGVLLEKF